MGRRPGVDEHAPDARVEYQLTCPRGHVVGGLDARLSVRGIDVSFLGRLGSPVNPGITTTRSAVFAATYVGSVGSRADVPSVHRLHAGRRWRLARADVGRRVPARAARDATRAHRAGSARVRRRSSSAARRVSASSAPRTPSPSRPELRRARASSRACPASQADRQREASSSAFAATPSSRACARSSRSMRSARGRDERSRARGCSSASSSSRSRSACGFSPSAVGRATRFATRTSTCSRPSSRAARGCGTSRRALVALGLAVLLVGLARPEVKRTRR